MTATAAAVPGTRESAVPPGSTRDHLVAGIANVCLPAVTARRCCSSSSTTIGCWPARLRAAPAAPRSRPTCWRRSGIDRALAAGSLRLSLGWSTTQADIDAAVEAVPAAAARLQAHARDGAPA